MDNTQKPGSPFDINPPTGGTPTPTFDPIPPPITPPPVTPPWPPPPPPSEPFTPVEPNLNSANLSSGWPPAPTPPAPPPPPPPPNTSTSPLDNPWGAPPQPPPISNPSTPPPWTLPASPSLGGPQTPVQTSDSPPTDLSHLVGNNPQPEPTPTNLNQAETLVVPSTITPETSTEPPEHSKKGLPKWLIGVGAGLLLAVLGTSVYFILGIGQTPKTTSLPAVDTSQTTQIKPPAPIATPVSQQGTSATDSASFGDLQGGGQQATRAGDLLRQGR